MEDKVLIFDYDIVLFKCGFGAEKRQVQVTHIPSGRKTLFDNKTAFWGRKKNVIEGYLGELNLKRSEDGLKPFTRDEFEFETIQTPEPVENALFGVKQYIKKICDTLECDNYYGYIGDSESFRLQRSTLWEYKGKRKDAPRPILKDEIKEYLVKKHKGILVKNGLESDDVLVMDGIKHKNSIIISNDKDNLSHPIKSYNPDRPDLGIIDGNCFGELYVVEKKSPTDVITKEVKGYGRKFFYHQLAYGDDVDCYRSNCVSDLDFGEISSYNALNDCKTDRECFEAIKGVYKLLYPEQKKVIGWRGDEILVDWKYVLSEIWDMARMIRWEGDNVTAEQVFRKYGLWED